MKAWKSWIVLSLCLACVAAAFAAPDWTTDQKGNGYGYGKGHGHGNPH